MDGKTVGYIMTFALFVYMCAQPVFGAISDRIGRRSSMLAFSLLSAIFIYPVMVIGMRAYIDSPIIITLLLIFMMMLLSFYTSISGLVKAEMFPTSCASFRCRFLLCSRQCAVWWFCTFSCLTV